MSESEIEWERNAPRDVSMTNVDCPEGNGRLQGDPELVDELLTVVEPSGEWVATMPRSRVHASALWHEVFHCLVVRSDEPARAVLQRRRFTARAFPGMLDVTSSGHLLAGELPADGVRELTEETGLVVEAGRLVPLGKRLIADNRGEGRNREVAHVYLLCDDTPLSGLRVDAHEVAGFVEVDLEALLRVLDEPAAVVDAIEIDVAGDVHPVSIRRADLVPVIDGYWIVLATMAMRHVAGIGPLAI